MPATETGPAQQRRLAWWLTVFAGYAAIVAVVTQGPSRSWGTWAAAGYALAALAARRSRGAALSLLIGACGAVAAPTIWLAARWQPGSEPAVVARAAFLLVRHGSPYLPSSQLPSAQSYNPYLPAMSVFGFPRLAGLTGVFGSPASWMAVTSLALVAAAIGVGPPQPGGRIVLWYTALAVVTPVLAFPMALGETDPPVIALMCLALACASRSAASTPAGAGPGRGHGIALDHLERAGGRRRRHGLRDEGRRMAGPPRPRGHDRHARGSPRGRPLHRRRGRDRGDPHRRVRSRAARSAGRVCRQHHCLPARADAPPDPGGQPPARPPTGNHRTRPPGRTRLAACGSRRGRSVARPATT